MVSKNIFKWILVKFEKKNPEDIYMYVKQLIMYIPTDRFHGVMVSVLISSVLDCRLMPLSGQTKDNNFGIYYFAARQSIKEVSTEPG
jgi:hypothetical protein